MIKNVVFDIDGTLIDTERAYMDALLDVLNQQHGWAYTYDQVVTIYGIPGYDGLVQLGFAEKDVPGLLDEWHQTFTKYKELVQVFPGIINTLKTLQEYDVAIGVVTSKNQYDMSVDFKSRGLNDYFTQIVTADDTAKHKPNPEPMLKMLAKSQIPAHETLYIGDTAYDMQCAHGAGVKFALASWGAHDHGQFQEMDYFLSRPAEIIDLVR
ncbi:HAD family hydrolase [Lapidilactobacillus achengensis]|uniref:HAD family hydrolase n=1 Tax=Lapidilactobacillus achengensis TaxID=2486000 RepID=A0ABW1UR06_9LACO|nr:HAD family hydrolase [Lapidilactobacillus achengensis]